MKNNKGMTMVEVMVAFVILLLGVAFLYRSTLFSLNQTELAREVQKHSDDSYTAYYNGTLDENVDTSPTNIQFTAVDGKTSGKVSWSIPIKFADAVSAENQGEIHIYFFSPGGA